MSDTVGLRKHVTEEPNWARLAGGSGVLARTSQPLSVLDVLDATGSTLNQLLEGSGSSTAVTHTCSFRNLLQVILLPSTVPTFKSTLKTAPKRGPSFSTLNSY